MTAPPDSTPAGLPPAGRCDGIAGDAETTTGPLEDAGIDDETAGWALRAIAEAQAERDRARRIAVALESEVAALTDALTAVTHEPTRGCVPDHPIHRTPARVRAQLEGQA